MYLCCVGRCYYNRRHVLRYMSIELDAMGPCLGTILDIYPQIDLLFKQLENRTDLKWVKRSRQENYVPAKRTNP